MRTRERLGRFIETVLADSERAQHWAAECGWMPGSGHCRRQRSPECQSDCIFRTMLDGEADHIRRERQRRRPRHLLDG